MYKEVSWALMWRVALQERGNQQEWGRARSRARETLLPEGKVEVVAEKRAVQHRGKRWNLEAIEGNRSDIKLQSRRKAWMTTRPKRRE